MSSMHWHHQWCFYQEHTNILRPESGLLKVYWAWSRPSPVLPEHRKSLALARSLQLEYKKISILGEQIPADTEELEAHIEGLQLAKETRRDWCTGEALMPHSNNTQPLSWKHKRSLRQVGIQLRYHRVAKKTSKCAFLNTGLKPETVVSH